MFERIVRKLFGLSKEEKEVVKLNIALPTKRQPTSLAPHIAYAKRRAIRAQIIELQSFLNEKYLI